MFDLLMLALLVAALVGAVGFVHACVDLTRPSTNGVKGQQ